MDTGDLSIEVAGESVALMPERTALWRGEVLLVADLHWGKAQSLQARGLASPCTFEQDSARLEQAIGRSQARTVIILGDLVHDTLSVTPELSDRIAAWRARIDSELILTRGNHDRHLASLPDAWRIRTVDQLRVPPFRFTHKPKEHSTDFVWSGHVHPVCSIRSGRDRLRLSCFAVRESVAILPSFGTLTGGAPVSHEYRRFAVAGSRVIEV